MLVQSPSEAGNPLEIDYGNDLPIPAHVRDEQENAVRSNVNRCAAQSPSRPNRFRTVLQRRSINSFPTPLRSAVSSAFSHAAGSLSTPIAGCAELQRRDRSNDSFASLHSAARIDAAIERSPCSQPMKPISSTRATRMSCASRDAAIVTTRYARGFTGRLEEACRRPPRGGSRRKQGSEDCTYPVCRSPYARKDSRSR